MSLKGDQPSRELPSLGQWLSHPIPNFLLWRSQQVPPSFSAEQPWRWFLPFLVVAPMLAIAGVVHKTSMIFPEGAALSFGVFVLCIPGWTVSRWRLIVVLPIAALMGMGLSVLNLPLSLAMILGITGVLILLHVLRSLLAPSLSAALIPILFHIHSWFYPSTVLGVSIAVTVIGVLVSRSAPKAPRPVILNERFALTFKFFIIAVLWISVATVLHLPAATLAPPLFVSTYDVAKGTTSFPLEVGRALLFFALGFTGVVMLSLMHSDAFAGLLTFTIGLSYMAIARRYHPPILSVALLALIVGHVVDWKFGLCLMVGSLSLYAINGAVEFVTLRVFKISSFSSTLTVSAEE